MVYIIVGTALEFGIPLDRVWDEVQRSNMAKVDPVSGKVSKRPDGKVEKPQGWVAPDVAGVLAAADG
jgi:predicted HAD superfamily Cof-like phosphohydrolase